MSECPTIFITKSYSIANRMIYITDVEEESIAELKRAVLVMQSISDEPIDVYVDSYGGSVYDGLGLFDLLVNSTCHINTYCTGKAMSMGLILFLAGDTRVALPNSTFMAHGLKSGTTGTVKTQIIDVTEANRLNNILLNILTKGTKKTLKWWTKTIEHEDYYFTSEMAIKMKVIKN